MNDDTNDDDTALGDRVKSMRAQLLDLLEGVLDSMAPLEPAAPALAVKRRQVANLLRLWAYCHRSACRRAQCCRGEPRDCLHRRHGLAA